MSGRVMVDIGRCGVCGEREAVRLENGDAGVEIEVYCPACGASRRMLATSMGLVTLRMHAEPTSDTKEEDTHDAGGADGDGQGDDAGNL